MNVLFIFYSFLTNPINLNEHFCVLSAIACCSFQRGLIKNNAVAEDDTSPHYHEIVHHALCGEPSQQQHANTHRACAHSWLKTAPSIYHFQNFLTQTFFFISFFFFFSSWRLNFWSGLCTTAGSLTCQP